MLLPSKLTQNISEKQAPPKYSTGTSDCVNLEERSPRSIFKRLSYAEAERLNPTVKETKEEPKEDCSWMFARVDSRKREQEKEIKQPSVTETKPSFQYKSSILFPPAPPSTPKPTSDIDQFLSLINSKLETKKLITDVEKKPIEKVESKKINLALLQSNLFLAHLCAPNGDMFNARLIFNALEILQKEIRIHSFLLTKIKRSEGVLFYYLLRTLDSQGRGIVRVNKTVVCLLLRISQQTLTKYLRNTRMFTVKSRSKYYCTVNYRSLERVCLSYKIYIGYAAYTLFGDLVKDSKSATVAAVYITALGLQNESLYIAKKSFNKAKKQNKNLKKRKLLPYVSEIFDAKRTTRNEYRLRNPCKKPPHRLTSLLKGRRGALIYGSGLYLDCASNVPYGASQQYIADVLKLSRRTVNAALHSSVRLRLYLTDTPANMADAYESACFFDEENGTNQRNRFFKHYCRPFENIMQTNQKERLWQSSVCLYDDCYTLSSMRFFKKRFHKLASRLEATIETARAVKVVDIDSDELYLNPIEFNKSRV